MLPILFFFTWRARGWALCVWMGGCGCRCAGWCGMCAGCSMCVGCSECGCAGCVQPVCAGCWEQGVACVQGVVDGWWRRFIYAGFIHHHHHHHHSKRDSCLSSGLVRRWSRSLSGEGSVAGFESGAAFVFMYVCLSEAILCASRACFRCCFCCC